MHRKEERKKTFEQFFVFLMCVCVLFHRKITFPPAKLYGITSVTKLKHGVQGGRDVQQLNCLFLVFLGFLDLDKIGERVSGASSTGRIDGQHNLNSNTQDTLLEVDMSASFVDELSSGVSGVDHETILELLALSSGGSQFTGDDNFATLSTRSLDGSDNTIGGHSDGDGVVQFEFEGLSLGSSANTSVLNSGGEQFNGIFGVVESLLDQSSQFSDSLSGLSDNLVQSSNMNSDFRFDGGGTNFDTSITVLGQRSGQKFVQFSLEDSISDELLLLVEFAWRFWACSSLFFFVVDSL